MQIFIFVTYIMKLIINIILINLICFCLKSQTLEGFVKDKNTSEPLIGANIVLEDGNGTSTDIDGKYSRYFQENTKLLLNIWVILK